MARLIHKETAAVFVALTLWTAAPGRCAETDAAFRLPKDRDTVFRKCAFTNTTYIHFAKDGSYRQIAREHMGIFAWDRGTWTQDGSGQIELRSTMRVKDFRCGPLRVCANHVETLEALSSLEKDIRAFLATNEKEFYTEEEIAGAWGYKDPRWPDGMNMFSPVAVDIGVDKISKEQITEMLQRWRDYLKSDSKSRFYLVPVLHRGFVLLASKDDPFMIACTPECEVKETADRWWGWTGPPAMVYVLADFKKVEKEMKTTQPFIFFPELNRQCEDVPKENK